jgi:hypothetical protein
MVELDVEGDEEQAGRSCMFKYTGCPWLPYSDSYATEGRTPSKLCFFFLLLRISTISSVWEIMLRFGWICWRL